MSTALQPPRPALPLPDKHSPPRHSPKGTRHSTPDPPHPAPPHPAPSPPPASPDSHKPREAPDQPDPSSHHKDEPADEGIVDMETFNQILELDEDEDLREFSTGMVEAYFEQATGTFKDMDSALEKKDLQNLSSLGHFLKGSSAALGVVKVMDSCEKIQHYGQCRDEECNKDLSNTDALAKINVTLSRVKEEYAAAEKWLKNWLSADVA